MKIGNIEFERRQLFSIVLISFALIFYIIGLLSPQKIKKVVKEENDYTYTAVFDGYAVSKGNNFNGEGEIFIPDTYLGQPITEISDNGFRGTNLTVVYLPPSLKRIGDYAFADNRFLVYMEIPESVITVGNRLFDGNDLYCTHIRIGGIHNDLRWYAKSDEWRTYVTEAGEVTYNAGYDAGYKLYYDEVPKEYEIIYPTPLYKEINNEAEVLSQLNCGDKVKKILSYHEGFIEVEINDLVGFIHTKSISTPRNASVYVKNNIGYDEVYLYPLDMDSSFYKLNLGDIGLSKLSQVRVVTTETIVTHSTYFQYSSDYMLVEFEDGQYYWTYGKNISFERDTYKLTLGFLFNPFRNLFVKTGNSFWGIIALIVFFTTPSLVTILMIKDLGNLIHKKIDGDHLYIILVIINFVIGFFVLIALHNAYYTFNDWVTGVLFGVIGLIYGYIWYNRFHFTKEYSLCIRCNKWDGVIDKRNVLKKWSESFNTTTTTTYGDGRKEVSNTSSTTHKALVDYHCHCENCQKEWKFSETEIVS